MNDDRLVEDIYNLTPLQQGMLFHGLYTPDSSAYWEQLCLTLCGDLDPVAFRYSWQDVVARHPALRTHFHWEELDEPLQVVQSEVRLAWHEEDWRSLSPSAFDIRLRELLDADRQCGFDFGKPPLMRFYLIQGPGDSFTFIWGHHHILLDGWSGAIVFLDLAAFYEARCQGEVARLPRPRPFRDYILWLQDQDDQPSRTFWRSHLQQIPGPAKVQVGELISGAKPIPQRYRQQARTLSKSATDCLQSFLRRNRLTLNAVIQGAWSLLLSHYSGEFDVVFGTVVSGRSPDLHGAEHMVGLLINTIPVRVVLDPAAEVLPWLHNLQAAQVERGRHAHLSLAEILSCSGLPPDIPLFETILSVENYPVGALSDQYPSTFRIERLEAFEQTNYPLAVVVSPDDGGIVLKITADADRFARETVERMLIHFANLIVGIAERPAARLVDLALEPAVNLPLQPGTSYAPERRSDGAGIHRCFEWQAQQTPQATAVISETGSLSYGELNERANRLARYLQDQGTGPDDLVGICANRSLEMVVALLGVLKSGGAYVPLDPGYPVERLRFMLADAGLSLVLTDPSLPVALGEELTTGSPLATRLVDLKRHKHLFAGYAADNIRGDSTTAEDLAYVIYTSGSTGRPKGVMITHGALLNHMHWMIGEFSFHDPVRVLQKTPFSFDASVWEFFLPLMCGGTLVLAKPDGHQDLDYLVDIIRARQISVLQGVPSFLELLVAHEGFGACTSLTHVFSGGEILTESLRQRLQARISAVFCNLYGPTETCIDATFHVCPADGNPATNDRVPIGRPIANAFVSVRDAWGHIAPLDVAGELWIGGQGLARGYWNRPELTEEKFVLDPAGSGRVYRTGDLVQRRSDGTLQFLGRLDQQVKLRGYRIELGEIEAVLEQHPAVGRAIVVVGKDHSDRSYLVAYIMPSGDREGIEAKVCETMRQMLPSYMIPVNCVVVDNFPQTPNGKVDRRQLSTWQPPSALSNGYIAPGSETEQQVAAIWEQVLNLKEIGVHDNFFQLGGHSLTAMQVLSRIRDVFQIKLSLRMLFDLPTVSELARRIETHQTAHFASHTSGAEDGDEIEEISI